ncbi:MAG: hypothetical protein IJF60_00140 [Agathobacter sp.]|nr:hypothetical protein [Agathobacter sp.]
MSDYWDNLIKDAFNEKETPSPELNRQILNKAKENLNMKKRNMKKLVAAACMGLAVVGSVSVYAAYRYLSPAQIAEEVSDNGALAKAFESEDAITVNEIQQTNGYDITFLGLVSGKNLDICVPENVGTGLNKSHTYAAVAVAKSDGMQMEYRDFCVSPLINGVSFAIANNATLDALLTFFEQDGIMYYLIECDNIEIFANRGVQLGVVDSFGDETDAFVMNEQSGIYEKNVDYEKTNALFSLPLDKEKADDMAAEKYLKELIAKTKTQDDEGDIGGVTNKDMKKVSEFVRTITPENIDHYFARHTATELTARPDENGWIEFGYCYIAEDDFVYEGASGYITYIIEEEENFVIRGYGYGKADLSDLQITTIWRNTDGSFTSVMYRAKVDMKFILE